jgi:predicted nucleic acid-binding protein
LIVVSDTSPLVALAHQIELLHELYAQVSVPRQVYEEVTVAGAGLPGAEEVRSALWIRVHPDPSGPVESLQAACAGLGVGEKSAIYLASVLGADLILIDEERARRAAKTAGFTAAGSIAISNVELVSIGLMT